VLVREARAAATEWVGEYAAVLPGFRGAFYTGSTLGLAGDVELAATSDVDIAVVVAGVAPRKLGKFRYRGALLEVTYLPWAEVAGAERVARTYYLAPSFATDQTIADPSGHLGRLTRAVAGTFDRPAAVRRRCADVFRRIHNGLSTVDGRSSWPELVTGWLFPTSLATQVLVVAARRSPTVRLRYLAAREVLAGDGIPLYGALLGVLGCTGTGRAAVQRHLDGLAVTFGEAAAVARTPFFFSADITPAARPVAIDGSQQLIDAGDHREAVFWIIASYARCQRILDADAPGPVRRRAELRFRAAVGDLLGLHDVAGVLDRRDQACALWPDLRRAAAAIIDAGAGG
jgi:hypothetical protein